MNSSHRNRLPLPSYTQGILAGDRIILSRAITVSESTLDSDRQLTKEILHQLISHTGNSFRIGVTGIPGVGKSTFINALGGLLIDQGMSVAVLAIDPSSQISKGSILGDKTRMHTLASHPKAYVRPSPTAGSLGGVTRRTREALLLCEAAGYEVILIETVGVGQSEIAVHHMVDAFLLLAIPHAGDELQGIKRGIMEMANLIFINKAEGEFLSHARNSKAQLSQALRLYPTHESGWQTEVLMGSALKQTGLETLWERLLAFRQTLKQNGSWEKNRKKQALTWMLDHIRTEMESRFFSHPLILQSLPKMKEEVESQRISPIQAAEELLQAWWEEVSSAP